MATRGDAGGGIVLIRSLFGRLSLARLLSDALSSFGQKIDEILMGILFQSKVHKFFIVAANVFLKILNKTKKDSRNIIPGVFVLKL